MSCILFMFPPQSTVVGFAPRSSEICAGAPVRVLTRGLQVERRLVLPSPVKLFTKL